MILASKIPNYTTGHFDKRADATIRPRCLKVSGTPKRLGLRHA